MAKVVDTFELRHVSTTYSEDKDGNTLTHFNCRGNAAGFGLVYDPQSLPNEILIRKLIRIGHAFARDGSYNLVRLENGGAKTGAEVFLILMVKIRGECDWIRTHSAELFC